jgi:glutathione reductase (NADPH)
MNLNIPGSENVITSDQFLEIEGDNLPNRIVFVGGGYISFEFAHVAARAGAEVTILHRGKQPLEHFDPDLVTQLVQRSREIGIDLQVHRAVKRIDKSSDGELVVHASDAATVDEKISTTLETDMVVHGAGRVPNID